MVGMIIKSYMNEKGIKYAAMANALNLPPSAISLMLNEKRKITAEEYFLLCEFLQVPLEKFLGADYCSRAG